MNPKEFTVVALRECQPSAFRADAPEHIAAYWRQHVATERRFNPQVEQVVVILLNSRARVIGHQVIGMGVLDAVLLHAREVYRAAIIRAAKAVVLAHNHPSGDPSPSRDDLKSTAQMRRAGDVLGIELKDHVIIGGHRHVSLRAQGYFSAPRRRKGPKITLLESAQPIRRLRRLPQIPARKKSALIGEICG